MLHLTITIHANLCQGRLPTNCILLFTDHNAQIAGLFVFLVAVGPARLPQGRQGGLQSYSRAIRQGRL